MEGLEALSGGDVPHLDGGVSVATDEYVVPQLHATRQRLVPDECVQTRARLRAPHTDGCVQRPTHYVHPVKLHQHSVQALHHSVQTTLASHHTRVLKKQRVNPKPSLTKNGV